MVPKMIPDGPTITARQREAEEAGQGDVGRTDWSRDPCPGMKAFKLTPITIS